MCTPPDAGAVSAISIMHNVHVVGCSSITFMQWAEDVIKHNPDAECRRVRVPRCT